MLFWLTVKVNIAKLPVGNVDQALKGKVSGVRITQSTGNYTAVAGRPPNAAVEIGSKLGVRFIKEKLLLMDADTGLVINGNSQSNST